METPEHLNVLLPIDQLKSVGTRNISRLHKLGIRTIRNLLWHFPSRYEDYSQVIPITGVQVGEKVNIQGEVIKISSRRIFPRQMTITEAVIQDPSGAIRAVWFNQPYIVNSLAEGSMVSLAGKVALNKHGAFLSSPVYEKIGGTTSGGAYATLKHTAGLVPVYPETEGITSKYLRFLIQPIIKDLKIVDPLPQNMLQRHNLISLQDALTWVHYPTEEIQVTQAKTRLAFDDLLLFQLKALLERRKVHQLKSVTIAFDQDYIQKLIASLPFELTKDQKVAAWEILQDIGKSYPMNRLLEGDVGSGKTVVALIAAVQVAQQNHQTVFMAPTEVLATQHFATITALAKSLNLNITLLTSSGAQSNNGVVTKPLLKKQIANGKVDILIGTHAVIQKDVKFKSLALVIIDEQHRFGIAQRAALLQASNSEQIPHLLSMTATPIPRTLALTIFGDLDISLIKEKPKNRQQIITQIVGPDARATTYDFIRQQIKTGRQVFVICPRIESAEPEEQTKNKAAPSQTKLAWADVKAVQDEYQRLSKDIFPDLKVAMLHGKMKPKEKTAIMAEFKDGWYDILISTSVIEVGVDIPNASIMMIEGADRFGLAQLHQFRGRVGRGEHQSYCLLLTTTGTSASNQRLKALVQNDDGFALAEKDMMIRGPGEFFGIKQSGLPDLTMASLANVDLIKKARLEARTILKDDPSLKAYPLLRQRLEDFQKLTHFE